MRQCPDIRNPISTQVLQQFSTTVSTHFLNQLKSDISLGGITQLKCCDVSSHTFDIYSTLNKNSMFELIGLPFPVSTESKAVMR